MHNNVCYVHDHEAHEGGDEMLHWGVLNSFV